MSGTSQASAAPALFLKTKLCRFQQNGKCSRGSACKFAHSEEELQPLPNFARTKLCPDMRETGCCPRGSACKWAHGVEDLRARTLGHARLIEDFRALLQSQRQSSGAETSPVPPAPVPVANAQAAPQTTTAACQMGPYQTIPLPVHQAQEGLYFMSPVQLPVGAAQMQPQTQTQMQMPIQMPMQTQTQMQAQMQTPMQMQMQMQMPAPCMLVPCGGMNMTYLPQQQPQAVATESADKVQVQTSSSAHSLYAEQCRSWKSFNEDEEGDLPPTFWSRQSTLEPADGPLEEFGDENDQALRDEDCGHAADWVSTSAASCSTGTAVSAAASVEVEHQTELQAMAAVCGLTYSVKNSFLAFNDDGDMEAVCHMRRARSTGDLAALTI